MRINGALSALVALGSLSNAVALPFDQSDATCSLEATETVYVTVAPALMSMSSTDTAASETVTVYSEPASMSAPAVLTVTTHDSSASTTEVSSLGPIATPPMSVVSSGSVITTETYTLSVGPTGSPVTGTITLTELCPGAEACTTVVSAEPTEISTLVSAPDAFVSTFLLTTTITSGYTPQVVETSTYTVIETFGADTGATTAAETTHSLSTASFTLTLATTVPGPVVTHTSSATSLPIVVSPYGSESSSPALTTSPAPASITVFTITLPGGLGSTPEVITVTATAPAVVSPTPPAPSIVTMTTTVSSGITEISLTPPTPVVSDVVMTYTVTAPDGAALTTWTMSSIYTYTPPAGVGTSFITAATVTQVNTVTVTGLVPPFPNTTTNGPVTSSISGTAPGYTFTTTPPFANVTASLETVTINGSAVITSIIVPLNTTTLVGAVPTGSITSLSVSASETTSVITGSISNATPNGTAVETAAPVNSTTTVGPPPGTPTELPPFPTNNGTESALPPSGTAPSPNGTAPVTTSVIVPLNSTTLALPLPTNGTSINGTSPTSVSNGTVPTSSSSPGQSQGGQSHGGASPTASANGTTPASPSGNQTTSGNAGPTTSLNGTAPTPTANQTAGTGPKQSSPSQGGHGGQGAPSASPNGTSPAPTSNQTTAAGPSQSGAAQSASSQGGQGGQGAQGGKSQGAPSQGAPSQTGQGKSQSAPAQTQSAQGKSQGGQGQSQGGQGQTQGGQGQPQTTQGQSQGGQGKSQGGQGQSQGGQGQSQGGGGQGGRGQGGGLDQSQTALGLPNPTGVPGASQATAPAQPAVTQSRSSPGLKARAMSPKPTATAACGNSADKSEVTLDFDDLPTVQVLMAPGSHANDLSPVPMYNPYHRFTWSEGFRVFPASVCPYKSSSGQLMLEFSNTPSKKYHAAEIGVGALQVVPCFRFDFTSFRVGCASSIADCKFNVTGLTWDNDTQTQVTVASHTFNTRACSSQKQCKLNLITGDEATGLTNLTSLLIDVTAGGEPQKWWADDLVLNWTDSSCDSAVCRSYVRDTVPKRGRRYGLSRILDTLP